MSKLDKHANLYDKDGNLLRHVNEQGILEDYSIEELEELIDKLASDKDENGKIKNPQALNNANSILWSLYAKYGNPHIGEILNKLHESSSNEEVTQALEETKEELENVKIGGIEEEYAEFEEV